MLKEESSREEEDGEFMVRDVGGRVFLRKKMEEFVGGAWRKEPPQRGLDRERQHG